MAETRCQAAAWEPVFCRERATKSEDSMEERNSSREDLKLDFVTCFTLHLR